MAYPWTEAGWRAAYSARIGLATYGVTYSACSFIGGVAQAPSHGLAIGDRVVFLGTTGVPLENVDYAIASAPTPDTFTVPSAPIPDQACQYGKSRKGEIITYGRDFQALIMPGVFEQRWASLTRDFPIQPADTVLVVGCANGRLIEAAHDAGFPNVYGVENSAFVLTGVRADVIISQIDFTTTGAGQGKNQIKNDTGQSAFNWVITEDLATSFSDQEVAAGSSTAAGWLVHSTPHTHVINMVTEAPVGAPFNNHTLEEWKALVSDQSWVSIRLTTWRVL